MKKILFHILLLLVSGSIQAQYTVSGGSGTPLLVEGTATNHAVYLLNGLSNAKISFTSDKEITHQWYKYNQDQTEEIDFIQSGNTSTITDVEDGWGYYVFSKEDTSIRTSYVWIIDYSRYLPRFYSLGIEEDEDKCSLLKIVADVEAEPLSYIVRAESTSYQMPIDRTYHLHYTTL
ncbi:hypothetical protein LJB91_02005, partial [Bacteroidales bacterium OttesenSCG-928-L03]|nr:hypothetical protein [Bacteroidales bacterium OttesenSCG-928-L03]